MTIITDIYTCINSHNAQALENIFADGTTLKSSCKWQENQYIKVLSNILSRCVEVHTPECFDIILGLKDFDNIDSKENIFGPAFDIAIGNYLANPVDNNYYFVNQIIKKKPTNIHTFIHRIIKQDNFDIFIKNLHLINTTGDHFIENLIKYTILAVTNSSHKTFEFLYRELIQKLNTNQNKNDLVKQVSKEVASSSNAIIFLNQMEKYGFTWDNLLCWNVYWMSDSCFDYLYGYLKQLDPNDFSDKKFKPIVNLDFSQRTKDQQYKRTYLLLQLPIKFNNLNKIWDRIFKIIEDSTDYSYFCGNIFLYLHMCWELKPETMDKLNFFPANFDTILAKSKYIVKPFNSYDYTGKPNWCNNYCIVFKYFQELLCVLKAHGVQLKPEYETVILDYKPEETKNYIKWKKANGFIDKVKKTKSNESNSKKQKKDIEV